LSRILITGINGFIGSSLAALLIKNGHSVKGIIRPTADLILLEDLSVQLFYGDVTEYDSLLPAVRETDLVIHVAGLASDWGPWRLFEAINIKGTQNMAHAAAAQQVKRFVHISTAALYGFPNQRDMDETFPQTKSIFPYCETKRIAEEWLWDFAKSTDMEVTAIRPGNVYGPKDHTFIVKYLEALESGKIAYVDHGWHLTCPVYIDNLTEAVYLACLEPAANGEAIIITDGLEITWKTFTEKLADALHVKYPSLSVPYFMAYGSAYILEAIYKLLRMATPPLLTRYRVCNGGTDYHFSINKARSVLNYAPGVSLDDAVQRTVEWYRSRKPC